MLVITNIYKYLNIIIYINAKYTVYTVYRLLLN